MESASCLSFSLVSLVASLPSFSIEVLPFFASSNDASSDSEMGGSARRGGRAGSDGVSGATFEGSPDGVVAFPELLVGVRLDEPADADISVLTADVDDEEEPIDVEDVSGGPPG